MESRVAASSPPLSRNWPPEEDGKSALRVEIDEVMKVRRVFAPSTARQF
jgi:hypothetical protein